MGRVSRIANVLKTTGREFADDSAVLLAAAVAFYATLSLAPVLVLLLWLSGLLGDQTQQQLVDWITRSVGPKTGDSIQMIIRNAGDSPNVGTVAGLISVGALLLSATGLFAQLQKAMNIIWDVKLEGNAIKSWLRRRLSALGVMLLLAVLLVVSVVASALLMGAVRSAEGWLPGGNWLWWWLNLAFSVAIYTLLFGAVFKVLPDVQIAWRHTLLGAVFTALLFTIGKMLIGLYFGHSTRWAAYGAAGSLVTLLVWIYYSSIIFFLGAELTQVWARSQGEEITPDENAVWANRKPAPAAT